MRTSALLEMSWRRQISFKYAFNAFPIFQLVGIEVANWCLGWQIKRQLEPGLQRIVQHSELREALPHLVCVSVSNHDERVLCMLPSGELRYAILEEAGRRAFVA